MASIFISYSSRDERAAAGLQTWLQEHDHEAVLRPCTKKQEQGAFDEVKAELAAELDKADLVLFLVTPFWQASKLCQWEKATAQAGARPLVALLEAPSSVEFSSRVSIVDLTKNRDVGLADLRRELERSGGAGKEGRSVPREQTADELKLQGAVIVRHTKGKTKETQQNRSPESSAASPQSGVNQTLEILRRGIRWNAVPGWFASALKLPVAGAAVKRESRRAASPDKKRSFKMPQAKPLLKKGGAWVSAGKARMAAAAVLVFVLATAVIGFLSDRTIGGKDAVRQELADVKKRQSLLLSRVSNHLRETGEGETALLLALEAMDEAQGGDDLFRARNSLYAAFVKMQKNLVIRGHDNHVASAVFSPDGKYILSASWDRTARVWQLSSRKQVLKMDQHEGFVNSAVYSPDQSLILTAALDNHARLFNARTGKLIRVLKGHSHDLASAVFSRDGRRIVTASGDQTARVWDVAGGKTLKSFLGHKAGLEYADFSPDGNRIVTASADRLARILDIETGDRLAALAGHTDVVRKARYDPRGKVIATASQDKTVRLWEARSGVLQRVLRGHEWAVLSASFSPDGKRLVTASKDKTARIWDVGTGDLVLVLQGHTGIVSEASFAPDGRMIVTASGDGTMRLWPLAKSDRDLVTKARRMVSRCLTLEQRKKYFLGDTPPEWCVRLKKPPFNK